MKKWIGLFIVMLITLSGISVGASESPAELLENERRILWGDANGNGTVEILDATRVQRHLAGFLPMIADEDMKAAIVSGNDTLSIIDATLIQRFIAGIIDHFPAGDQSQQPTEGESAEMKMTINSTPVTIAWEDGEAVEALKEAVKTAPLTIRMSMYGGFEQVGSLGMRLPRNDTQITTAPGDVILYSGNQMVVFYGSNTWAYTRLGHITDQTTEELTRLLSNGDVTITLSC